MGKLAIVILGALLVACTPDPRYTEAPDPTWKDRGSYCYMVEADPEGRYNTVRAWTDTRPVIDGERVTWINARVGGKIAEGAYGDVGHENKDFYEPYRTVSVGANGVIAVTERCSP